MKFSLRSIGLLGFILFASLFALTFGVPTAIENSAKDFVKSQIEIEVKETYQDSKAASVADKAKALYGKLGGEKASISQDIENKLPEKIAATIASMCGYDCEKKKALTVSIKQGFLGRIASIEVAQQSLDDIIKGKYVEIVGNLKADLRIFLGANALMFLILLSLSFFKPAAITHLFLPGMLLLISTITASAIYLFGQDWFYTILYNDYMGFGYVFYLGLIFGFLMDITFNKARVTTSIINSITDSSVSPC